MGVRALILAAGRGSRLGHYTENRPKCLAQLAGRTLIDRQLATLRAAGIEDIVLITGYRSEMLEFPGTRQVRNARWAETNMVESLFCADALFTQDMIVAYSDIVYEPRVLADLLAAQHEIAVTVDRQWRAYWEARFSDPLADAETLRLDDAGHIVEIGNQPQSMDEIQAQYMGLMRFRGSGVVALHRARSAWATEQRPWMEHRPVEKAYMTDLLTEMIRDGASVHAVPVSGGWLEIDTEHDLEMAEAMLADGTLGRFYNAAAA